MRQRVFWISIAALLVHLSPAFADAGSAVIARQACMKANSSAMNALLPMFKGEKPFDQSVVARAVNGIEFICSDWKTFWPEGSHTVPGLNTRADAAVWSDAAGFQRSTDTYFAALKALADSKDEAGFKATFPAFGKTCGACHETYRTPEN